MKNEELGWCGARGSAGLAAMVGLAAMSENE